MTQKWPNYCEPPPLLCLTLLYLGEIVLELPYVTVELFGEGGGGGGREKAVGCVVLLTH